MAYKCPRCGAPVKRGHSGGAQAAAGLVGALFCSAFGSFVCKKCGKIPRKEFPAEIQSKMATGSIVMVIAAIALALGIIWLVTVSD